VSSDQVEAVMRAARGPINLATAAAGLEVSPSNASRICDRLLKIDMVDRREDPADRRNVVLSLTSEGQALIDKVNRHRRTAIRGVLKKMSPRARLQLTEALNDLATAAGEPQDVHEHAII
jgi:DNA-binding MarR family transcriptional regulator